MFGSVRRGCVPSGPPRCGVGAGRVHPAGPLDSPDAHLAHQPGDLVPADVVPAAVGGDPQLARPIDRVVGLPQRQQHRHHRSVAHRARRRRPPPWPTNMWTEPPATQRRRARLRTRRGSCRRTRRSSLSAVELRPEKSRRPLQNLVRVAQLTVLLAQPLELGALSRRHPRTGTRIDLGLTHPQPDRLHAITKLICDTPPPNSGTPSLQQTQAHSLYYERVESLRGASVPAVCGPSWLLAVRRRGCDPGRDGTERGLSRG